MFPADVLAAYSLASLMVVLAPGPDNILALGRGLSQGPLAAFCSALGNGTGIMVHALAATFGLSVLLKSSEQAFWLVKIIGAAYLIWLAFKALRARELVTFAPAARVPLPRVFVIGLMSNLLNPKVGLFVLAFLPQFASEARGSLVPQMLVFGAIFAVLTVVIFSLLGASAARVSGWLKARPRAVDGLNIAAGLVFLAAGLSVLLLKPGG